MLSKIASLYEVTTNYLIVGKKSNNSNPFAKDEQRHCQTSKNNSKRI